MAEIVRFESSDALAAEVAERLVTVVASLQDEGRTPQIVLTGGSIANAIYAQIPPADGAADVDWSNVDFWWGDERYVAPDSDDRNARQARDAFLDQVGATRVHEMPSPNSACSVDEGARAYEAEIRGSAAHSFDLTLLSIGPDGHIASLFPGSAHLGDHDHIAVGVTGSPKPPPERITLTLDALNHSQRVWLFAVDSGPGGAKHEAFRLAVEGDPAIPASRVRGSQETIWFVS